jgi:hypothetical protein
MLKTKKRYVITSNALNSQGFRILSEGIDWSEYNNNPIMLYMHYRATGQNKDEVRVIGNVRELQTDKNGVVTGQPYFNEKYPFAVDLFNDYEAGSYNMFSLAAQPLEWSTAPEHLLPNQLLGTVIRSIAKEISCVDIGSNPEAFGAVLYDKSGSLIKLSASHTVIELKQGVLASKSWKELDRSGELPQLKLSNPSVFREKFFEQFGNYPNN